MMYQMELLVGEIIEFLQKWGLWEDVAIFVNGNKYKYTPRESAKYKELSYVEFTENVNVEEYVSDYIKCECGGLILKSYANPEHIFDMVFDGPLYRLLNYEEYEVKKKKISWEAWEAIFDNTDLLHDYMDDEYGCGDMSEFKEMMWGGESECIDYVVWDSMIFDTWEEYQEFAGEEYDATNAADYWLQVWERMMEDSKREIMQVRKYDEKIYIPAISGHVYTEFSKIFERYGLWYELGFSWSLTCYRK